MKSFTNSALQLAAFGFVAAIAVYAVGQPRRAAPQSPATAMATGKIPTITTETRLLALEKRATADAHRIHSLEVSLKNLEYALAHLPKPPPSTAPFCQSFAVSANPQGGTSPCLPYRCDAATGTCLRGSCSTVDDCDTGFVCDGNWHCVAPGNTN